MDWREDLLWLDRKPSMSCLPFFVLGEKNHDRHELVAFQASRAHNVTRQHCSVTNVKVTCGCDGFNRRIVFSLAVCSLLCVVRRICLSLSLSFRTYCMSLAVSCTCASWPLRLGETCELCSACLLLYISGLSFFLFLMFFFFSFLFYKVKLASGPR